MAKKDLTEYTATVYEIDGDKFIKIISYPITAIDLSKAKEKVEMRASPEYLADFSWSTYKTPKTHYHFKSDKHLIVLSLEKDFRHLKSLESK